MFADVLLRLIRAYFRIALRLHYSTIEVEGMENVPPTGPVLLLSNHPNALIDPLAVAYPLRRRVWFTAKHTLAALPGFGWLMRTAGVLTFQRQQDAESGASLRGNLATFAQIHERLSAGGAVLIFPEGRTHTETRLSRFKRGAARIALSYVEGGREGDLVVVPVGLTYDTASRFRPRLHVRFGPALDVRSWTAQHGGDDRALTVELMRRVGECTVQFETADEAARFMNAAAIVLSDGQAPPTSGSGGTGLGRQIDMARRLQAGAEALAAAGRHPGGATTSPDAGAIDALVQRVDRYRARLDTLGLQPAEVFLSMRPRHALRFVVRELGIVVLGLPIALFAALVHAVPYGLTLATARGLAKNDLERTTGMVFAGFVFYPLAYLIAGALAAWRLPPAWAAAFGLVLLPSLAFAVHFRGRLDAAFRRSRTFVRFARDPELKRELEREGRAIDLAIRALAGSIAA